MPSKRLPHPLIGAGILLAGLFLFGTAAAATMPSMEPDEALKNGQTALDNEEFTRAANIFEQAILSSPQDVPLNRMLGIAYYKEGRNEAAIEQLENTVELAAEEPEIHYALGVVYLARAAELSALKVRSAIGRAIEHLEEAIALQPGHVAAHFYLLQILVNAPGVAGGDLERARELNAHLEDLSPLHHDLIESAMASQADDLETAETLLLDNYERHPDNSLVNFALLEHFTDVEQYREALQHGERFLSARRGWDDGDTARAHFLMARAHVETGNTEQGLEHYATTLTFTENPKLIERVQKAVQKLTEQ